MDANAATFLPLPNLLAIDFDESEVSPEMIPIETFADLFHGGSGSFHTMNSSGLLFRVTIGELVSYPCALTDAWKECRFR